MSKQKQFQDGARLYCEAQRAIFEFGELMLGCDKLDKLLHKMDGLNLVLNESVQKLMSLHEEIRRQ